MTGEEWQIIWFTAWVAGLSTLLITPPAIGLGWLLARREWRGKSLVETVVSLPLVLPPVATGLILLKILGRRGLLGGVLHSLQFDILFSWRAVVVALGVMAFPLLVRSSRTAFEGVNLRLEQIARTLGASDLKVFLTITLPLAQRGIVGGLILAFARVLGEFGATIMVAGNIPGETTTISLSIYQSVQLGQDAAALRLLGVAVGLAFIAVWSGEWLVRKHKY